MRSSRFALALVVALALALVTRAGRGRQPPSGARTPSATPSPGGVARRRHPLHRGRLPHAVADPDRAGHARPHADVSPTPPVVPTVVKPARTPVTATPAAAATPARATAPQPAPSATATPSPTPSPVPAAPTPFPATSALQVNSPVRVIDGDTLDMQINGRRVGVGLIGVSAPATDTPCGREATRAHVAMGARRRPACGRAWRHP
ncbi:MAG: hypothetical protein U0531_02740 [Dehalococcoidia bacterium]